MKSFCDTAKVSAYLDGELSPDERTAVEVHLAACPQCAAILREFRQNDGAVRDAMTPTADPPGLEHLEAKVLHQIASPRRMHFPWARAAAAVIIVATIAFVFYPRERRPVDGPQPPPIADRGGSDGTPLLPSMKPPDLSVTVAGETVMLNIMNGADVEDLPVLQSAVATNAVRARISALKESNDIDPTTRLRLAQMETVLIGLDNVEPSDAQEQLRLIQGAINDNGLINACQEAKRRMGHAMD